MVATGGGSKAATATATATASTAVATTRKRGRKKGKSKGKNKSKNPTATATAEPEPNPQNHNADDQSNLVHHLTAAAYGALSFLRNHDLHLFPSQSLSLETLLSSTSTSFPKLLSLLSLPPQSPSPPPPPPLESWFDRFLASADNDYDPRWAHFFNLSKPSFTLLLRLLTPSLSSLSPLSPNRAVAAALFRLAHSASFAAVSRRFGIDPATACRAFYAVCKAINEKLGHLFEFKSDINRTIVGFGWISLPNCCGVLGFEKFRLDGDLYGKNGFLLAQALVDSEGRFLDVSAGWPGLMSPEDILRKSMIFAGVEESREYLNGPSFEVSHGNSIPQYILGDSCFPLMPWLLTPYKDLDENEDKSAVQLVFNSVHKSAVQLVGMAFGRLRKRWKLVDKNWSENCIDAFPFVIVACCLLQNFLIKCSEAAQDDKVEASPGEDFPAFDGAVDETGMKIRDSLASHLSGASQRR